MGWPVSNISLISLSPSELSDNIRDPGKLDWIACTSILIPLRWKGPWGGENQLANPLLPCHVFSRKDEKFNLTRFRSWLPPLVAFSHHANTFRFSSNGQTGWTALSATHSRERQSSCKLSNIQENLVLSTELQIGHRKEFPSWRLNRQPFRQSEWRRANARNVSLETLSDANLHYQLSCYLVILSHRRSTTVSSETYPLYSLKYICAVSFGPSSNHIR